MHPPKIKESIASELLIALSDINKEVQKISGKRIISQLKKVMRFNNLKNESLYVTLEVDEVITPSQAFTQEMADGIEFSAELRFGLTNAKLELFMGHLEEIIEVMDGLTWATSDEKFQRLHELLKKP